LAFGVNDDASYGAFAFVYDQALGNRFVAAVAPLVDSILKRFPAGAATHLDVACGTGLLMKHLIHRGFRSTGIDLSPPMLSMARSRNSRLVLGDFRLLPFRQTFGLVTCMYDSLNHLLQRSDLLETFRSIHSAMNEDSLLIFDVNHPAAYPRVWGNPLPFEASGPRFRLVMDTSYSGFRKLGRANLHGWAEIDGSRVPVGESHTQRAWSRKEILRSLDQAALIPIAILGFDPFDDRHEPPTKIVFVCRTRSTLATLPKTP
jgi:SAM-dependent methyltransferase